MKKEPVRHALLEIGMEEMPARFMPPTLQTLKQLAADALKDAGVAHGEIQTWGTPRRIALLINDVAAKSTDRSDFHEGPPPKVARDAAGNWTPAAIGFAKKEGVSVDKLELRPTPKGERYGVVLNVRGQKTEAVLKELFPALVRKLTFPKSMIWDAPDFRFARPVRWFVALLNGNVVKFRLAGLTSDRNTYGLRALGGQKISVAKPEKYKSVLQGRCILVDPDERRRTIAGQVEAIAKRLKASPIMSPEHLDEVVHLTEFPTSILGHFPEAYLRLPREVLITVLKKHQKFFPIETSKGQLTNAFVGVRNGPSEAQDDVRDGYERVINARFSDAQFFYEKDSSVPLQSLVEKLAGIGFHEKLGSMLDKTHRIEKLVALIADAVGLDTPTKEIASHGATLSKVDLLTQMVGELPELQGVAGRFYSDKQSLNLGHIIEQHYWPLSAEGKLPESVEAALVALADKLDTLAANFSVGLVPTGSADPYGLRRAAVGVIRILADRKWDVPIWQLINMAFSVVSQNLTEILQRSGKTGAIGSVTDSQGRNKDAVALLEFLNQRLTTLFSSKGYRLDEIDAVLSQNDGGVVYVEAKLRSLKSVRERPEFGPLSAAIKRARNLMAHAAEKGIQFSGPEIDLNDARLSKADQDLKSSLDKVRDSFRTHFNQRDYQSALLELATLHEPLSAFFKDVMVMVDDEAVRAHRLRTVKDVMTMADHFADFSKLQAGAPAAS